MFGDLFPGLEKAGCFDVSAQVTRACAVAPFIKTFFGVRAVRHSSCHKARCMQISVRRSSPKYSSSEEAWPNSANINLYRDGRQGVGGGAQRLMALSQ